MSFRSRLLLAFAAAAVLPLVLLASGVRRQLSARLAAQHERRVEALARVAMQDLQRESASIALRLATLAGALAEDNRFRLAAVHGAGAERGYLLDYAEHAMHLTGLSMLQLQDENGRILSSGHFRNEFDRLEPALPRLLATSAADSIALLSVRTPDGRFLALARVDSVRVGGRRFTLVGGIAVDDALLQRFARDGELAISLVTPEDTIPGALTPAHLTERVAAELPLTFIDARAGGAAPAGAARLVVAHSIAELDALDRDVTRWLLAAVLTAVVAALVLVTWLSAGLSRPLADLARATAAIDLEGPEVELATARGDEIGALARRFAAMSRRLRASASRLRQAERRATVGEMARQVNHDIKNGLIPIRNVLRHLSEVQERRPAELPSVFGERRATLESGIGYLETLARSYARLTPPLERRPFDANAVAREVAGSASAAAGITVEAKLADALPPVVGDPVVLRRILDNLLRNAVESLASREGSVTLETRRGADGTIHIVVADTGRGMTEQELTRAFDDFYTTKSGGTGLGLSVVRRLTADLEGSLHVVSEPGRGTTFTIELPAALGALLAVSR
jgi:signal transduction histidine kinase